MKQKYGYGYVRVSTDKQEELSPDSQEKLLREYASKNQIILLNIFCEIGFSGRKAEKRPRFQEMIGLAKSEEHPVDVILVWKYSRFARNQEESIVYKSLLKKQNNVEVISVSEPLAEGPFGSLIERIIEWMDEYYSIRLSGEVFRGMRENALRGASQSRPPLGYKVAERGKPPVIVPEEAEIIRIIFDQYVHRYKGQFEIACYLNSLGYKTARGKAFERRSVEYILQNPAYCGMVRWNRTHNETNQIKDRSEWILAEGRQEPIISRELFDQAQKRLQKTHKSKGARPSSSYHHWLSGLVRCPACGRTLTANTMKRANGLPYAYFCCYGYSKGKCDKPHGISSLLLEKEVLLLLKETVLSESLTFQYEDASAAATQLERHALENQLSRLDNKETRILEAYASGIDTLTEYRKHKELLQSERNSVTRALTRITAAAADHVQDTADCREQIHNIYDFVVSDKHSDAEKHDALRQIVDKIIYDRETDTLKIYFIY